MSSNSRQLDHHMTNTLEIIEIGHPTLREVARELSIDEIADTATQQFFDDLITTKREANGAGIAANQVDRALRVFVVEVASNPRYPYKPEYPLTVLINPEIEFMTEDKFDNYEGCLSIPNLRGMVPRCPSITVKGLDRHANPVEFTVRGLSAGTFQHEQDHLEGILFPDIVEDSRTLCTWNEFANRYQQSFSESVQKIEARYNS